MAAAIQKNKVLTTVTKGGSTWHYGVRGRGNVLVPVLLGIPLVDMRRRTGWGEGDPTTNQCDVIEVSEGVTTGVSANLHIRGSVPRAAAHCTAAH